MRGVQSDGSPITVQCTLAALWGLSDFLRSCDHDTSYISDASREALCRLFDVPELTQDRELDDEGRPVNMETVPPQYTIIADNLILLFKPTDRAGVPDGLQICGIRLLEATTKHHHQRKRYRL